MEATRLRTSYENLSVNEVKDLFARDQWVKLDLSQRLNLLQEYSNIRSEKLGMDTYPKVFLDDLKKGLGGYYADNEIHLNINEIESDFRTKISSDGQVENTEILHSNLEAFETICHEHQHAYQDYVVRNKIEKDMQFLKDMKLNDGISMAKDYPYQITSLYIPASLSPLVYRLQPCENDAFLKSELETDRLIEDFNDRIDMQSPENIESIKSYQKVRAITGQEAITRMASLIYGIDNPCQEIRNSLESIKKGNINKLPNNPLEKEVLEASLRTMDLINKNENRLAENLSINANNKLGVNL